MLNKSLFIEKRKGTEHLSLDGAWSFTDTDEKTESPEKLSYEMSAALPKSVAWCLFEAGKHGHPYEGLNSRDYLYIKNRIWYFKRSFFVEESQKHDMAYLCFDGVSYYSRVWLNGILLGEHEGMFGGPVCEVSTILKYGEENKIIVEITPPSYHSEDHPEKIEHSRIPHDLVAPWHVVNDGLTQNGHFCVAGIWRSVRIEFLNIYHITNPYIFTEDCNNEKATLSLEVPINTPFNKESEGLSSCVGLGYPNPRNCYACTIPPQTSEDTLKVAVKIIDDADGKCVYESDDLVNPVKFFSRDDQEEPNDFFYLCKKIEIKEPKLWYPNGYGEQNLYSVNISLYHDEKLCDTHTFKTAVRTVEVVQGACEKVYRRHEKFQFVINGQKIFLKGMNLTQTDVLYLEDKDEYDWVLSLAKNEGVSMVRIWNGGGVPENDIFYDLCDKYGLMVWQDAYIANCTSEHWDVDVHRSQLVYNICRTRNHPSLTVFCGGNEFNPYTAKNAAGMYATWDEYNTYIPDKIFYRTTPNGGSAHIYSDMEPTWYRHVYKHVPFVAESGIHSFPVFKTFKRIINKHEIETPLSNIFSDDFKNKFPEIINHFSEFQPDRVPRMLSRASHISNIQNIKLENLVEAVQMSAYEFYLIMAESMLENYPTTTGLMPWVFKRPWPTSAIQLVDAFGHPQAQYYGVKKGYDTIHPFVALEHLNFKRGEEINLPVKMYCDKAQESDLKVVLQLFDDKMNKFFESIEMVKNASYHVTEIAKYKVSLPDSINDAYFFVSVKAYCGEKMVGNSFYYPKVLSVFENKDVFERERAGACPNMYFEKGPFLKEQITSLDKASLCVDLLEKQEKGRREVYILNITNTSKIPAFPVKIDTVSDVSRCMCDDNIMFVDAGETRKIKVTVDKPFPENDGIVIGGWNTNVVIVK